MGCIGGARMRLVFATLAVLGFAIESAPAEEAVSEMSQGEARAFHDTLLTVDTHIDIGRGYATVDLDPGRFTRAQVDLPKMRAGGLDAGMFIVFTSQGTLDEEGYSAARETAEKKYRAIDRMIRVCPGEIAQVRTADDSQHRSLWKLVCRKQSLDLAARFRVAVVVQNGCQV